mgnify:CR=1 FL=1
MEPIPQNPNVSPQVWTPDTYIYISTQPVSTGSQQDRNLLLLAPYLNSAGALTGAPYSLTAGTAQVNSIEQYTSVDRVNSAFARRSLMANDFRAALQAQPVGLNIFCAAVAEPTASNFTNVATQLLGWEGTAVGSGEIKIWVKGFLHRISVASGDTAATAATTCSTAMGGTGGGTNPQQPDCPFVPGAVLTDDPVTGWSTVPLVCLHRGEVGNSKPVVVDIPPEITGLKIGVGSIEIATNAAGASGSPSLFTIRCGALSVSVSLAIGTTPANAATAIAAAINAATFGLTATAASTAVKLYYRNGWAVHRIQINSTEDALGQTYTLKDRMNATHAAVASTATTAGSATYTGLQGSGTPTLTTVLANRRTKGQMLEWYSEYNDSTSLGAIATHIEQYANGYYQENQRCTFGSDEVLDVTATGVKNAKQRLTDPSPNLTTSWRYIELVAQDCFSGISNLAVELAADLCAALLPFNFDGHELAQGTFAPVLGCRGDTELDALTRDVAMRTYHLTPIQTLNGKVVIPRGVTSWGAANREWSDFSYGRIFDDSRYRIRSYFNQEFNGKVLFTGTTPRVDNAFTLDDVEQAGRTWLLSRDGITIDGARELARYVRAEVDPDEPTYIRFAMRLRPPREAHVKGGTLSSAPRLQ